MGMTGSLQREASDEWRSVHPTAGRNHCPDDSRVRKRIVAISGKSAVRADLRPGVTDGLTSKVETVERYLRASD